MMQTLAHAQTSLHQTTYIGGILVIIMISTSPDLPCSHSPLPVSLHPTIQYSVPSPHTQSAFPCVARSRSRTALTPPTPPTPHLRTSMSERPRTRRAGEAPSVGLTEQLQDLGFSTDRLKTGTPARVDRRTVDFTQMKEQPGDDPVGWFSFDPAAHVEREQLSCYLTHTNAATHDLIRENLHETPTYGGWADSKGPRYCPSIEDKIVRL